MLLIKDIEKSHVFTAGDVLLGNVSKRGIGLL